MTNLFINAMDSANEVRTRQVFVKRNVVLSKDLYGETEPVSSPTAFIQKQASSVGNGLKSKFKLANLLSLFPILTFFKRYNLKKNLKGDIFSGFTIGCVNVPQGLAASLIMGVPPQHGIYTSCFQPFFYFIFGTAPHLSIGVFLTLSMVTSSSISKFSDSSLGSLNRTMDESGASSTEIPGTSPIEVAICLSFLMGLWLLLFRIIGLASITNILSEQFMQGFINAICVMLLISQMKGMLGLKIPKFFGMFSHVKTAYQICAMIAEVNPVTLAFGFAALLIQIFGNYFLNDRFHKKIKIYVPVELLLVIFSTLISYLGHLDVNYDVAVVGAVPDGFPAVSMPKFHVMQYLLVDSLILAILLFATSYCYCGHLSKLKGTKRVSPDQELIAFGTMHIACAFLQCMPGGCAFSRSKVQVISGGQTQLTSIISSILLFIVILFAGPALYFLPKCILSAIIISSVYRTMINIPGIKKMWKTSKVDLLVYSFVYFISIILGANYGMILGVAFSIIILLVRFFRTPFYNLTQFDQTEIYFERKKSGDIEIDVKVPIVRFNGPINFISQNNFKKAMEFTIEESFEGNSSKSLNGVKISKEVTQKENVEKMLPDQNLSNALENKKSVIVDFTAVSFIDYSGLDAMKEVFSCAKKNNVTLYICGCSENVFRYLHHSELCDDEGMDKLFASVQDAKTFIMQ